MKQKHIVMLNNVIVLADIIYDDLDELLLHKAWVETSKSIL